MPRPRNARGVGLRDDDRARRAVIIRERKPALDVEFEAGEGGVVTDGGHRGKMRGPAVADKSRPQEPYLTAIGISPNGGTR
jgi:hypothetical protein